MRATLRRRERATVRLTGPLLALACLAAAPAAGAADGQVAYSARSEGVRFVNVNLGLGSRGRSVRLLQSELNVLHYAVPLSGVLDEGTGRALVAYRKMTGLERTPYAGRRVFERL